MDPNKVNDVLDIKDDEEISNTDIVTVSDEETEIVEVVKSGDELTEEDFTYIRDNLKDLIDTGKVAIDELLQVARQSQHPRAYEVLSTLMKTMTDTNKELLDTHKRKGDILKESRPKDGPDTINNNLVIATPAELQKMLAGKTDGD